jgi:hypothetical protein
MPLFKVHLQEGSKRDTKDFRANSYQDILGFFSKVSTMQVVKISQIVYESLSDNRADTPSNYDSMCRAFISNKENNLSSQIFIPHIRATLTEDDLIDAIKKHLLVKDSSVTSVTAISRY